MPAAAVTPGQPAYYTAAGVLTNVVERQYRRRRRDLGQRDRRPGARQAAADLAGRLYPPACQP